ncbi:MAG: hypothetical protein RIC55_22285 [Pirellulaceae bacterium]
MDFIADDPNRKCLEVALRLVLIKVGAIPNRKPPVMDAAADDFVFDDAVRERSASMGALVGQGKEAAPKVEDADHRFRDDKHSAFALGDVANAANRLKIGRIGVLHKGILPQRVHGSGPFWTTVNRP